MNPMIKDDPVMRQLLHDLDSVTTKRDFTRWKASFVDRFAQFLSTDGARAAHERRNVYQKELGRFVQRVQELEGHIRCGDLTATAGRTTVKARKCLAEVHKHLTNVADQTETLIPGTGEQARAMGYTKFHMGAVLIRDGFAEYDRLSLCADIMERLRQTTCLAAVADKQLLEEMDNYVDKFGMFCDIMADLGLHSAMLRCHTLNKLPDDPIEEPEPVPEPQPPVEEESESEVSLEVPVEKSLTSFDTSFKANDDSGRLEITTRMNGSMGGSGALGYDADNSKSFSLDFPGIKPPSGPFIKFLPPDEYARRKEEREKALRLKEEMDKIAYQPVKKIDFGLGNHYHGRTNTLNSTITPDLADHDYSSNTDASDSETSSSQTRKKKTKKKIVVKKVVKKKVLKKKAKEGGTTETTPDTSAAATTKGKVPKAMATPKQVPKAKVVESPSPPVRVIKEGSGNHLSALDDDELTMTTLSPPQQRRSKIPPSALEAEDHSSSESEDDDDDDDLTLTHLVDFDGMEGVKGRAKRSSH